MRINQYEMISSFTREELYHRHQLSHQQIDDFLGENKSSEYPESKAQHLSKLHAFLKVSELFEKENIKFIPQKGPVLSYRLYGDPLYRAYNDLDFFIKTDIVLKATEILLENGFKAPFYNLPVDKCHRELLFAVTLREEIMLDEVSFSYGDGEKLFDRFSAVIMAHSITGIVGQSGRGKTTLIDLIAGLQKPDAGRIMIDGRLMDEALLPGWKAGLGYLPQDPFFIDGTLRENLVWDSGGDITDEEVWEVLRQVNATHLVKRFRKGLDAFVVNYPFAFSGGECQRLALARVLLRRPSVLLLDEATSSLDAENEATVMEVLAGLKDKITIVFVTHRESVVRWFDEVIKI